MISRTVLNKYIIILTSLLIFCASNVPAGTDEDYEIPVEKLSDQRVDIQSVIMAVVYNMKGVREQGIGPVMFDENFGTLKDGTGLVYREFKLVGAAITKDISLLDDEKYRELSFILEFRDPGLRTAFVDVTAYYYLGKNLIFLEKATAEPKYFDRNQIQLYFLPSKDVPPISDMDEMSYPEIAEMVSEHALSRDELGELPSGRMNRLRIVAINRCRQEQDVKLSLSISGDDEEGMTGFSDIRAFNKDGWPVSVADGFMILNTEPGFIIDISKNNDSEDENILVDRFSSKFK